MNRHKRAVVLWTMIALIGMAASHGRAQGNAARRAASPVARQEWKISFQLSIDRDAPALKAVPAFGQLSYAQQDALDRYVLTRLVRAVVAETKAGKRNLYFGPGGYHQNPLSPSGQLDVQATHDEVVTLEEAIGYLARQYEVIASRPDDAGDKPAFQITQRKGRKLLDPDFLSRFWTRLGERLRPLQQGFLPLTERGRPAIRIINTETAWSEDEYAQFAHVTASLADEFHMDLQARHFKVQFDSVINNWREHPDGSEYLTALRTQGQTALATLLETKYKPLVQQWIVSGLAAANIPMTARSASVSGP